MEHVYVQYPEERDVHMDGQVVGKTGATLMVEEGRHSFDLGAPADYAPASQERMVKDTSPIKPLVVVFTPEEGGA